MELTDFWPIMILAIAISIDGFSVGVTYGLRKIRLDLLPLIIISGLSTLAIFFTISIGSEIAEFINEETARVLGSIILITIGGWLVYSAYINYNDEPDQLDLESQKLLFSLQIKPLGIIVKILKEPVRADFDSSGTINISEAVVLGLALALDALGAGLGAGLSGISNIFLPFLIGLTSFLFVGSGFFIGKRVGDILPDHFELFPGLVIILLGLIRLL